VPKTYEYPGSGSEEYSSAAIEDLFTDRRKFFTNLFGAFLLHITTLGPIEILGWVIQILALTLTFMLPQRIYDAIEKYELEPETYVNLAIGSVLVGIILLTSGTRTMTPLNKIYNAITIGILTIVLLALNRIRKSMQKPC